MLLTKQIYTGEKISSKPPNQNAEYWHGESYHLHSVMNKSKIKNKRINIWTCDEKMYSAVVRLSRDLTTENRDRGGSMRLRRVAVHSRRPLQQYFQKNNRLYVLIPLCWGGRVFSHSTGSREISMAEESCPKISWPIILVPKEFAP